MPSEAAIRLHALLCENGLSLSLAESCTGGLASKMVTDVPGSSKYFLGSVVSYSNQVKEDLLQVPKGTIEQHGAVSAQTAMAMARGVRVCTGADIGASCTGIAGPGGGTEEKPVGLVFMAVVQGERGEVQALLFKGDRECIRTSAAERLLDMVRSFAEGEDGC